MIYCNERERDKRQKYNNGGDEPRVVAPKNDRMHDVHDSVDEYEIHRYKRPPEVDRHRAVERQSNYSPYTRDIGYENGQRGQHIKPLANRLIEEEPKPIVVVLLVLMDHIRGQMQERYRQRYRPIGNQKRRQDEQQKSGKCAPVYPLRD